MSEPNPSTSNINTQTTTKQKTGGPLSLSNHASNGESGDSIGKEINFSALGVSKENTDNTVNPQAIIDLNVNK